jgi:hypothetical protein
LCLDIFFSSILKLGLALKVKTSQLVLTKAQNLSFGAGNRFFLRAPNFHLVREKIFNQIAFLFLVQIINLSICVTVREKLFSDNLA